MSRLDDELRTAFRRQPPPADFAEQVMERIAEQPAPRLKWWQRLAVLFEPPKLRWVAIGVTASLLVAIGAAQYSRMTQVTIDDGGKVAKTQALEGGDKGTKSFKNEVTAPKAVPVGGATISRKRSVAPSSKRQSMARLQRERELKAQAEAAKEKLMLALHIASAALNDAQKAIQQDGPNPQPKTDR